MKRLAFYTLSLSCAFMPVAPAADAVVESNVNRPRHAVPARPTAARPAVNPAQPLRPNFQAPVPRNFQVVPRQQSFRSSPEAWMGRTGTNGDGRVQSQQPRVFTPRPSSGPSAVTPTQPKSATDPAAGRGDHLSDRTGGGAGTDWHNRIGRNGDRNQDWRNRNTRNPDGQNSDNQNSRNGGNRGGESSEKQHRGDHHHNWNGDGSHSNHWRDWDRSCHDRNWWRSRYNRFAFFGGGCYYWNAGYWFPAYGYDPYFTTYTYDAPIYAYNDLAPGDVIANVQQELQQLGYYQDEIDGDYGPTTRQALLDYQGDNGLPVTGEIDEETLGSLGLE